MTHPCSGGRKKAVEWMKENRYYQPRPHSRGYIAESTITSFLFSSGGKIRETAPLSSGFSFDMK